MDIELSSRGILLALFRQKARFLLVFLAVLLSGLYYLSNQKPVYEARSSMLVRFGREAVPTLSRPDMQTLTDVTQDRQEIMASFVEILKSSDLLRDAVAQFGAEELYPGISKELSSPVQIAVDRLAGRDLNLAIENKSNLISMRLWNARPDIAAAFSELLVEKFMARQAAIYNPPRTNFLKQQIDDSRQKLSVSQKEFQDFKTRTSISALDEELAQLINEKSHLSGLAFSALTEAQASLADVQAKEAEMRATNRPDSLLVQRQRQIVAVARNRVAALQSDMKAAEGEGGATSALASKMARLDDRIAFLESQRGAYKELEQQVEMEEGNLKYYQQRGEEARVNDVLNEQNITRLSVVDAPHALPYPVRPRKTVILAATLLAALLFGVAVAFGLEILDDRLTSPQQLARVLGVPVLATFDRTRKLGA